MISLYRIILALHLVAVISWMAAILYLYRLFVYHREETEHVVKERFQMMEKRLSMIILLPAALGSLIFGIVLLALSPGLMQERWMWAKLVLVVFLLGLTHFAGSLRRRLAAGSCPYSGRALRILNEIPALLMIGIIFLVILQPF